MKFIDLFCGIGGFRLAFEKAGCECVFSSDWDRFSQQTYEANFGHKPFGNIYEVKNNDIPKHNILCAGFPCQPFSLAGVSKKNSLGRKHGFEDELQGNLFSQIVRVLKKKPDAFVLENVKNLKSHDGGKTFETIKFFLQDVLNYKIFYKVIDGRAFVPQHRERIFIVGFKKKRTHFDWPELPQVEPTLGSILSKKVDEKYILSDKLWEYLKNYAAKHKAAGNGFGYGLFTSQDTARTLSARYHKDGSEILISRGKGKNPRRLTPYECKLLMGFPKDFKFPVSDTQAYRQCGNSVVVPVVEAIAKNVVASLKLSSEKRNSKKSGK